MPQFIKNNYHRAIKLQYLDAVISIGAGFLLFFLLYFVGPKRLHFDTPQATIISIIATIPVIFLLFIAPLMFVLNAEHLKKHRIVWLYEFRNGVFWFITPKMRLKKVPYKDFRKLQHPYFEGTKSEIKWHGSDRGHVVYVCSKKYYVMGVFDTKAGYRVLINYLRWVREHPEDFKATIQWAYDSDEWRKDDALKKSIRKKDEKIWLEFLEEWWKKQERGKDYWLKTPLEKILKDLHSPYTLEELDNPSEEELVEIDESKLIEEKC